MKTTIRGRVLSHDETYDGRACMADWLVGGDRGDVARRRLVSQAAALIASRGLDAFSIDELAARAHCSRATIYRHAGGRAQLIEAVLSTTAAPVLESIRAEAVGTAGEERARIAITAAVGHRCGVSRRSSRCAEPVKSRERA